MLEYEISVRHFLFLQESVRRSAKKALSSLIKFTVRNSSRDKGEEATKFIGLVLPVLIGKGIRSSYKENRLIR